MRRQPWLAAWVEAYLETDLEGVPKKGEELSSGSWRIERHKTFMPPRGSRVKMWSVRVSSRAVCDLAVNPSVLLLRQLL